MNIVIMSGRLVKDPFVKTNKRSDDGTEFKVARFRLGVNCSDGETYFADCKYSGNLNRIEAFENNVFKGYKIEITAEATMEKYNGKNGEERRTVYKVLSWSFAESKEANEKILKNNQQKDDEITGYYDDGMDDTANSSDNTDKKETLSGQLSSTLNTQPAQAMKEIKETVSKQSDIWNGFISEEIEYYMSQGYSMDDIKASEAAVYKSADLQKQMLEQRKLILSMAAK